MEVEDREDSSPDVEQNPGNVTDNLAGSTPISYWTLLANPQLATLCFLRIAEPLASTSILSYLLFQLRYLSPDASEAELATRAGLLLGAKTFAKVCTGVPWGVLADARGRKPVLLIGLFNAAICTVGYGFSTNFRTAIIWQVLLGASSNEIATTRTIAAELYADASVRDRSRALLLPLLVSSIGMVFGPILGGFTSRREGLGGLSRYPYALPNLIVATWYATSVVLVALLVKETGRLQNTSKPNSLTRLWTTLLRRLGLSTQSEKTTEYEAVPLEEVDHIEPRSFQDEQSTSTPALGSTTDRPGFRQMWSPQLTAIMTSQFVITGHITAFGALFAIFLSTPTYSAREAAASSGAAEDGKISALHRLLIQGGLGLSPPQLGTFLTCATILFALFQSLIFPRLLHSFGTVRLWRSALLIFPVVYLVAPFTSLLTSMSKATLAAWVAITGVMILFMTAHAAAVPPIVILINECVEYPNTRGTINAIGTSVGNLARSVFPVLVMGIYGVGLKHGVLAGAFWVLTGLGLIAILASRWVGKGLDERAVLKRQPEG